jgi:hypothetical protein
MALGAGSPRDRGWSPGVLLASCRVDGPGDGPLVRLLDATVHLVGGGDVFLRVLTQLEASPRLGIVVEPVHP